MKKQYINKLIEYLKNHPDLQPIFWDRVAYLEINEQKQKGICLALEPAQEEKQWLFTSCNILFAVIGNGDFSKNTIKEKSEILEDALDFFNKDFWGWYVFNVKTTPNGSIYQSPTKKRIVTQEYKILYL